VHYSSVKRMLKRYKAKKTSEIVNLSLICEV
jgi:hypothetical protein